MLGLLAATAATGEGRYRDVVIGIFDRWWTQRGGRLAWADHVTPGLPLLLLVHRDARWMPAARALGDLYRRFPRRGGVPVHRPDLEPWTSHVWVDCLYTDGPFLALLARVAGERAWVEMACEHTLAYVDVLWDASTGLFAHGYDAATGRANAIHWGRELLLALADRIAPQTRSGRGSCDVGGACLICMGLA
jgi:unsaturated rhamnogalacturonyl hydrolase